MPIRELIGLSGFFIGVPLLIAWLKWRVWLWQAERSSRMEP